MRIVGGALSGRRLAAPRGPSTRPTSERVREAIASALEARGWIAERQVLDLYCGSGAMGLEAISRGAAEATLVDSDRHAIAAAQRNVKELGLAAQVRVMQLDLHGSTPDRVLRGTRFDLIFVDPPYALIDRAMALLSTLATAEQLAAGAVVVIEHATRAAPTLPEGFGAVSTYRYGDTGVILARAPDKESSP